MAPTGPGFHRPCLSGGLRQEVIAQLNRAAVETLLVAQREIQALLATGISARRPKRGEQQHLDPYPGFMVQSDLLGMLDVDEGRSGCPINMTVELLGDRWSLIVLRDIIFGGHRRFRDLLRLSVEGIASNVLADRLKRLSGAGLLSRHGDPSHRQKVDYRLTEPAIQLVPVMAHLGAWGSRWLPTSEELAIRAQLLAECGPEMWSRFMDELREVHLREGEYRDDGVLAELTAAYLGVRSFPPGRTL